MIKLIIIWSLIIGFYLYTWIQSYNKTKSKSYVISIIKRDIKNLLFGFIVVFTLYWIVDKYEEVTDKEKEVFQNNKIEGK
jgi:polyferredoxin